MAMKFNKFAGDGALTIEMAGNNPPELPDLRKAAGMGETVYGAAAGSGAAWTLPVPK